MRTITDEQVLADFHIELSEPVDFFHERERIDHDAVADHADFSAAENSRRDEVQNIFGAAMDDGVTGVIPALAAHHDVRPGGEHVDDFSLSLVAPLRADQNRVGHEIKKRQQIVPMHPAGHIRDCAK